MPFGTVQADVIGTSVTGSNIGAGNASIMKNRIINGNFVISQYNGTSASANTINAYFIDRWAVNQSTTGKLIAQQNAGSVTPPVGFGNYLGITSQSAYSVGASDYYIISQSIEGFNTADLNWGTANAKTVTLSFQVYSSLTGTFGGSLRNSAANRSYPFSYSIPVANTWTTISVTIAGDTTGTWVGATNGVGMTVIFGLGVGSTFSGTAGAWAGSNLLSATGATSIVGTNGATFYITGVQLEVGSSATGYEYVNYQTSLANCMRYYEKSYNFDVVPSTATLFGQKYSSASAAANTTGYLADGFIYQVPKRATPTITTYDNAGNSGKLNRENIGIGTTNNVSSTVSPIGTVNAFVYTSGTATASGISYHYTISAEL